MNQFRKEPRLGKAGIDVPAALPRHVLDRSDARITWLQAVFVLS
jgi:hypothetical protein